MPELATPKPLGIQIQPFQPLHPASYFDKTPIPAPIPDTTAASAAQGRAAFFSSLAKTLTELPETLNKSYEEGRKRRVADQVTKDYETARTDPARRADLANFKVSSDGTVQYTPEDNELKRAQIDYYKGRTGTLYDRTLTGLTGGAPDATPPQPQLGGFLPSDPSAITPQNVDSMPPSPAAPGAVVGDPAATTTAPPLPLSQITPGTGEEPLPGEDISLLPPSDFQPAGTNASQQALASIEPTEQPAIAATNAPTDAPTGHKGGTKTVDPVTGIITYKSPNGNTYELLPGADSWKEVNKGDNATENALNRAIIARGKNPIGMTLEEKEAFLQTSVPLKPSEKLSATRDLRQAYEALPSTTVLFGKGQMPGLDQILERLDEIKKRSGGDFSKMSAVEGRTFVHQFNKFNDPNSAVLLGEYKAAADTLSIPDKFFQVINKAYTGESVTPQQAKEIYDIIKGAHDRAKSNYATDAADIIVEAKSLGIKPRRVGIPDKAEKWMGLKTDEETIAAPAETIPGLEDADKTTTAAQANKPTTPPAATNPSQSATTVNSQAEYDALPSGAWYKDSNGTLARKP